MVTARDLARALEYNHIDKAVANIYQRNVESFTERDSFLIDIRRFDLNMRVNPQGGDPHIRVFTKRGALKICMKSNQPRAVAVQEILIDLYEQLERTGLTSTVITKVLEQQVQALNAVQTEIQKLAVQTEIQGLSEKITGLQVPLAAITESVTLLSHQLASFTLEGTALMKVDKALQIKEAIQDIEAAPDRLEVGRRTKKWANLFEVTDAAIRNWRKNYASHGFTGLFRKEHPGKGIRKSTCAAAADRLKLVYLSTNRPTLKEVYKQIQDEVKSTGPETCSECCYFDQCADSEKAGWKIGSYKTAQRVIKEIGGRKILQIQKNGGS